MARFLAERGADVLVTDLRDEAALAGRVAELAGLAIRYTLGGHPEHTLDADVIFVSPGIPREIPPLVEAVRRGFPLHSETDLFFEHCPAPIIGVTGSSGKTTTTTLVGKMLQAGGQKTWVGGNIGEPLLGVVNRIEPDDRVVLELSSFQLEHLAVGPHIAAILNVTPNHLDRHKTMECYIRAKEQIVRNQGRGDLAIFGRDDPVAGAMANEYAVWHPENAVALFSGEGPVERGACLEDRSITVMREGGRDEVCPVEAIGLRGHHNVLNVLAACAIAAEAGASAEAMAEVVTQFTGVAHRLELVRRRRGVQWVNDSIATSPERSMAALRSYGEPIVLLAGGRDKHLPWDTWADLVLTRARHVILFGEASGLIADALDAAFGRAGRSASGQVLAPERIYRAGTLEKAVEAGARLARNGDVVLLSPGGTSYDAYEDFVERGEAFRGLVEALSE